jgi:hypothetical protein
MYFWLGGMYATSQIVVPRALQRKKAAKGGQHATTGGLNIPFSNQGLAKRVGGENAQREPEHSRIPKMEPDRPPHCFSLALILHLR